MNSLASSLHNMNLSINVENKSELKHRGNRPGKGQGARAKGIGDNLLRVLRAGKRAYCSRTAVVRRFVGLKRVGRLGREG